MQSMIERTRNRLVAAKLHDLVSKTGSYQTAVTLPDGKMTAVELDADMLTKALKKLFEARVYDINKRADAEREITETYSECVRIKSGKLTAMGEGFMDALISNLVEQAYLKRGNENVGN